MADIVKLYPVVREALIAEKPITVANVVMEHLVGDGYAFPSIVSIYPVVREALIREAPILVGAVVLDTLLSLPGDNTTQAYMVASYAQTVMMVRATMADPSTVRSMTDVPSYRQLVAVSRPVVTPFSITEVGSVRQQITFDREVLLAPQVHSETRAHALQMMIVQSRVRAYEPISMVYAAQLHSQVVTRRDVLPAPDMRTPITVGTQVQQIVQSRIHAPVVIQTYAYVPQLRMQAVQQDTRPAPISVMDAASLRMLVVREHVMPPPGIDDRVGQLREQVVQQRDITPPHGEDQVAQIRELVTVARDATYPLSATIVRSHRMLTIMHRTTYPPKFALGRQAAALRQQVLQARPLIDVPHSVSSVGSLRLSFVLERKVPRPIDVIDPSVGRHAFSLVMLAVQHRVTSPPEQISTFSRFAFGVHGQVVIGDAFPLPPYPEPTHESAVTSLLEQIVHGDPDEWAPVSTVTVPSVAAAVVVGDADDWIDASLPHSEVGLAWAGEAAALGDVFPDPFAPLSDAVVDVLASAAVLGDSTMPDPLLPLSEIEARSVTEFAALGDAEWSDPAIPLSEIVAPRLAAFLAHRDPSLIGQFSGSEISSPSVLEFYVIRDPTLKGISLRQGPRPVVSVTIS